MTSDPVVVIQQAGMVGLRTSHGYTRTYWLTPLDACDLADALHQMAEQVGHDAVIEAAARRNLTA